MAFDARDVTDWRPKAIARQVAFLPQTLTAPENTRARQLVARGRYPHQSLLATWSPEDERAVDGAMHAAGSTSRTSTSCWRSSPGYPDPVTGAPMIVPTL